jgi:hypothetical protein
MVLIGDLLSGMRDASYLISESTYDVKSGTGGAAGEGRDQARPDERAR